MNTRILDFPACAPPLRIELRLTGLESVVLPLQIPNLLVGIRTHDLHRDRVASTPLLYRAMRAVYPHAQEVSGISTNKGASTPWGSLAVMVVFKRSKDFFKRRALNYQTPPPSEESNPN